MGQAQGASSKPGAIYHAISSLIIHKATIVARQVNTLTVSTVSSSQHRSGVSMEPGSSRLECSP